MQIERRVRDVLVRFHYDPDLISELKLRVPSRSRRWEPFIRAWTIDHEWWPVAEKLFQEYGLLEGPHKPHEPLDTLYLKDGAPPELVSVAYRTLAKIHHPDRGGSNDVMRRVNLAYERMRK